jgi:hypothetical protein
MFSGEWCRPARTQYPDDRGQVPAAPAGSLAGASRIQERLTSLRWSAPNADNSVESAFSRCCYGRRHRKTRGGGTMPGQCSAHYTPRTARAIQWLGVFTLFQAIGIAGLALAG